MKVGTITFHWATNYGGVLQAYALQKFLVQQGVDVQVIDYRPARTIFLQSLNRIRHGRFEEFVTENELRRFRSAHLRTSKRTYRSNDSLRGIGDAFDIVICGSDQIWNESFIWHAERRPTLSYYLDFVPHGCRRIAYAASFGADQLTLPTASLVQPSLARFSALSVRENTGREILESMGLDAIVVVDPTLLLDRSSYETLIGGRAQEGRRGVYSYVLHREQYAALEVEGCVRRLHHEDPSLRSSTLRPSGMSEWLRRIRDSEIVVTNSFHGVVMSIIFHTPFISVPVEGSEMNNRLVTLLSALGLEGRFVTSADADYIVQVCHEVIDWERVESSLASLRADASAFLHSALTGEIS